MQPSKFLTIISLIFVGFTTSAQYNSIVLSNLSVNNNPLIPLDPVTGQPSDTIPRIFHFVVMANHLNGATTLQLMLGSMPEGGSDVLNYTAQIANENGMLVLKTDRFFEPIQTVPEDIVNDDPESPRYTIVIPVELRLLQIPVWKTCTVVIEDVEKKPSKPLILKK